MEISTDLNPNRTMAFSIKDSNKNLKAKVAGKEKLFYTYCKTTGHFLDKCWKISGTKPICTHYGKSGHNVDTYSKCMDTLKTTKHVGKAREL